MWSSERPQYASSTLCYAWWFVQERVLARGPMFKSLKIHFVFFEYTWSHCEGVGSPTVFTRWYCPLRPGSSWPYLEVALWCLDLHRDTCSPIPGSQRQIMARRPPMGLAEWITVCRLVLYTLDLIFNVAICGTDRSRPDSLFQEGDMSFLEKSYHRFWHRLRSTLSKTDIEPWIAMPVNGVYGIELSRDAIPLGIRIEGTSRCNSKVHVYIKCHVANIDHMIYRVTNSRVDLMWVQRNLFIQAILNMAWLKFRTRRSYWTHRREPYVSSMHKYWCCDCSFHYR